MQVNLENKMVCCICKKSIEPTDHPKKVKNNGHSDICHPLCWTKHQI
jgi:hypothetical protein